MEHVHPMKILPLASDSLGVRSLATLVEFGDGTSLLIDGGARLGPLRFGLAPTRLEERTLLRYRKLLDDCLRKAGCVVVSHYHYDHYIPDSLEYSGKTLFLKDHENHINRSQQTRGGLFNELQRDGNDVVICDGKRVSVDDASISFSRPVPHGEEDSPLGFVIMTEVRDDNSGETLLHTSDVQGPVSARTAEMIIDIDPSFLILDGAPTYLQEWNDPFTLEKVERNLELILDSVKGRIVMDHHHLRDRHWRSFFKGFSAWDRITNFAEFQGTRPAMLESMRREIWRAEHGKD